MSFRERRDLVSLYRQGGNAVQGVLFSLIRVAGSSYRQPGARMLALPDGRTAGTLSGGCLEAELLRRAMWMVRSGAVIEHFSTAFDDTAEIPYGLGCGGEVDVLAESLDTPEAIALMEALEATLQRAERTVVTLLPVADGPPGEPVQRLRRIVFDGRDDILFASDALPVEQIVQVRQLVRAAGAAQRTGSFAGSTLSLIFVERLAPVQRLIIFGGGEDARPVARLAHEMGWLPVVVDTRANRAVEERFPHATCVTASHAMDIPVAGNDAVILMTHSYQQDRHLLAELLQQPPAYLGLLGARHRSALLLQEASLLAGVSLADAVGTTHAPVGLDLGGEGPEAIALAIVAEVQQALGGREGVARSRRMLLEDARQLLADGPNADLFEMCVLSGDHQGEVELAR